jgi:hypothetical protein
MADPFPGFDPGASRPPTGPSSPWSADPLVRRPQQPSGPSSPWFQPYRVNRFLNRNANGNQFNKPEVKKAGIDLLNAYSTAHYFRHAGFGQAIRYTLGLNPTPSHMNDWIRAQHNLKVVGQMDAHAEAMEQE